MTRLWIGPMILAASAILIATTAFYLEPTCAGGGMFCR
jgi:hypothetical protein